MRKLKLQIQMSLFGYVARANGDLGSIKLLSFYINFLLNFQVLQL